MEYLAKIDQGLVLSENVIKDLTINEKYLDENRDFTLEHATDSEFLDAFFYFEIMKEKKHSISKHTEKAYKEDIRSLLEFLMEIQTNIREIAFPEVKAYCRYITERYSIRTSIRKLGVFQRLLKYGFINHYYQTDWSHRVEKPKKIEGHYSSDDVQKQREKDGRKDNKVIRLRQLSEKDAKIIIHAFEEIIKDNKRNERFIDFLRLRNRFIGQLLFSTGMRASELTSLNFSSFVEYRSGKYNIKVVGKGNKQRTIPVGKITLQMFEEYKDFVLEKYIKPHHLDDSALLFSPKGVIKGTPVRRMSYETLYKMVKEASRVVQKNPNISPHWFRHTYATYLLESGVPLATVKDILGHEDISTTNIYLEKINEDTKHDQIADLGF